MFEELTKRIDGLLVDPPILVAVSGYGGSGKTTLAKRLEGHYPNATLVQLDNFLTNHGEGEGINGGYDWQRFVDVVGDAKQGKALHYQWYDWHTDALAGFIDEPARPLVIIEGVRLLQPSVTDHVDLGVWIDCPLDEAMQRGIERDRRNKDWDEALIDEHIRKWHEVWAPKDRAFEESFAPRKIANLLYAASAS
jgi:uridine kinase